MRRGYISGTLLENTICYKTQFDLNKITSHPPLGFPGGAVVKKNLPANAEDMGSIPGLERSPGVGNGNPLLYSCLENSMNEGAWWAMVHEVTKSQTPLGD